MARVGCQNSAHHKYPSNATISEHVKERRQWERLAENRCMKASKNANEKLQQQQWSSSKFWLGKMQIKGSRPLDNTCQLFVRKNDCNHEIPNCFISEYVLSESKPARTNSTFAKERSKEMLLALAGNTTSKMSDSTGLNDFKDEASSTQRSSTGAHLDLLRRSSKGRPKDWEWMYMPR